MFFFRGPGGGVSYIFLAFQRFYLSPGVRTSGSPGQVLKDQRGKPKEEHAGRIGGGRDGNGRARIFGFRFFLICLIPDLGHLRYGPLGRGKTYKMLGKYI